MTVPKQHAAAIAVSLALCTTGEHAIAQTAPEMEMRLQAGSVVSTRPGTLLLDAMAVTPAIRYADSRMTVSASASAWMNGELWDLGTSDFEFEAYTPLLYGVRAEVSANASRVFFDPLMQNDQIDAGGRLHYMRQRGGVWLGSGVARPLRAATVSNVNISSGGAWTRLGSATLRGSVTSFFFTKVFGGDSSSGSGESVGCATQLPAPAASTPMPTASFAGSSLQAASPGCTHESRLTDLEGSLKWEHRLLEVTVRGGHRFGDSFDATPDSRQWASGQVAVWISSQVAAVAGGGREPAQPTRGLPARSFGSFGLMLAYWPIPRGVVPVETPASLVQAFEMRPAGPEVQRISARIGGVESVEVMGDFSDWEPMPLIRRGRDAWELLVPMSPGVHQINMRIDRGVWIAPPGMPARKDGFDGEVGIVVVR
jgi:hypothetical protein